MKRQDYELFVSGMVRRESEKGDAAFAAKRMQELAGIPQLADTPESDSLAEHLLIKNIIPEKAAGDAIHIALAAVHRIEYLLTWNCRRFAPPFGLCSAQAISLRSVAPTFTTCTLNAASKQPAGCSGTNVRSSARPLNCFNLNRYA